MGVAITGMGIISAIGHSVAENSASLRAEQSGLGQLQHISTRHAATIQVGEVSLSNDQLTEQLQLSKKHNYTRTGLLGLYAAREALDHAGIINLSEIKTGFISATTVGGMDMTERYLKQFKTDSTSQKYIQSHHAGDSTQKIADALGITEFVTTISTACSSAANAIMLGARLIKAGRLDRVVVGGTDALSKFTINGFSTLLIQSDVACTPFDANRKGLNLGEAAAFLVLESDRSVAEDNKTVLAYLSGYGNANDAYHQTASSENGEGAFLALQSALKMANLQPSHIDYINAHGTATLNNDLSESRAMQRIFGSSIPDFSSTKPFTGHTLAAAGVVEAVYAVLALQTQTVFPNLNFQTPMPETGLKPVTSVLHKELDHVVSNSFGFGGNCSTLIFSKA